MDKNNSYYKNSIYYTEYTGLFSIVDSKHKVSEFVIFNVEMIVGAIRGFDDTMTYSSADASPGEDCFCGMVYCYDDKWYPAFAFAYFVDAVGSFCDYK